MRQSKIPLRLATLEEMEKMSELAGGDMGDPYNSAYLRFLKRGLPERLAHFEAVAEVAGGEFNLHEETRKQLERFRAEFEETTKTK